MNRQALSSQAGKMTVLTVGLDLAECLVGSDVQGLEGREGLASRPADVGLRIPVLPVLVACPYGEVAAALVRVQPGAVVLDAVGAL